MPAPLDIPLALTVLTTQGRILPSDDWGSSAQTGATYAAFAAGWRGVSAVPTLAELNAAWTTYLASLTVPRAMYEIANDIFALSGTLPAPAPGTQKANIIADLFGGSPPKYQRDTGPNAAVLSGIYASITQTNGSATFNAAQQLIMASIYIQTPPNSTIPSPNANYLVHPAFDSSINVPSYKPAS